MSKPSRSPRANKGRNTKKMKLSQASPTSTSSPSLDSLADNILLTIAKFCGARDFVRLSRSSKSLHTLLMQEKVVEDVIRIGNAEIQRHRSSRILTSKSSAPMRVDSLEQLALYESAKTIGLLEDNRYHFYAHRERKGSSYDSEGEGEFCEEPDEDCDEDCDYGDEMEEDDEKDAFIGPSVALLVAVRKLLKENPSATVVLEAHSNHWGGDAQKYTNYHVKLVSESLLYQPTFYLLPQSIKTRSKEESLSKNRIKLRSWGNRSVRSINRSKHPFQFEGDGWVEIFVCIKGEREELELPPRPGYYRDLTGQNPFKKYDQFDHIREEVGEGKYGELDMHLDSVVNRVRGGEYDDAIMNRKLEGYYD